MQTNLFSRIIGAIYKTFVVSFLEFGTAAVYHTTDYAFPPLDRIQKRFLDELHNDEISMLIDLSLVPLWSRRDMAMLGLLHKVVLGIVPSMFDQFIFFTRRVPFPRGLRNPFLRHSRQLHDPMDGSQSRIFQRSLFGLIYTYNLLPQAVVDSKTVTSFQHRLQRGLKEAAKSGRNDWSSLFTSGTRNMIVASFQALFAI